MRERVVGFKWFAALQRTRQKRAKDKTGIKYLQTLDANTVKRQYNTVHVEAVMEERGGGGGEPRDRRHPGRARPVTGRWLVDRGVRWRQIDKIALGVPGERNTIQYCSVQIAIKHHTHLPPAALLLYSIQYPCRVCCV